MKAAEKLKRMNKGHPQYEALQEQAKRDEERVAAREKQERRQRVLNRLEGPNASRVRRAVGSIMAMDDETQIEVIRVLNEVMTTD